MPWLWIVIILSVAAIAVAAALGGKRERLTMLSENKEIDGWGNVTILP